MRSRIFVCAAVRCVLLPVLLRLSLLQRDALHQQAGSPPPSHEPERAWRHGVHCVSDNTRKTPPLSPYT